MGIPDREPAIRFVDHSKLCKFLRAERYVSDVGQLRRAFQRNGVFVAPEDRYGLTEFLPGMLLGPPMLTELLRLIPRLRPIFVSGIALRSRTPGHSLTLDHFFDIMCKYQGRRLETEDALSVGPVTRRPGDTQQLVSGEIDYDWSILTRNPFEPEQATLQYEARQVHSFVDVYTVSDRDRDLFKLSHALERIGNEEGGWEVVRVDKERYPDTESRHQVLIEIAQQLELQRLFVPLGVARYDARQANDLHPAPAEFDRSHRNRQGEVTLSNLRDVMLNLKERGAYLTMADMLFGFLDENRAQAIARIEVYIKLRHKRLDISLVDTRLLGDGFYESSTSQPEDMLFDTRPFGGRSYNSITTLDRYGELDRKPVALSEEQAMLRDLWMAISPAIFSPLVAWRPAQEQQLGLDGIPPTRGKGGRRQNRPSRKSRTRQGGGAP